MTESTTGLGERQEKLYRLLMSWVWPDGADGPMYLQPYLYFSVSVSRTGSRISQTP